jgi:nucleotide-binding universal stress UspA family protein
MSTIIVPTDFSATADNALNYAVQFAERYSFDVTLFHSLTLAHVAIAGGIHPELNVGGLNEDVNKRIAQLLEPLKEAHPSVQFITEVSTGPLVETLNNYCHATKPIAVFMGITGEGSTLDKLFGSNAIEVMNHTTYPVVIVPHQSVFKPLQKICLACDLKEVVSTTPPLSIKTLAHLFNAEVHILNIDYKHRNFTPSTPDEIEILESMLDQIKPSFHFIEDEHVQHGIDSFITEHNMDMVIVIPKRHPFFENLFHKSTTKQLAYTTHVPLLAVHAN